MVMRDHCADTPDQFIVEAELREHIARDGRSELLL